MGHVEKRLGIAALVALVVGGWTGHWLLGFVAFWSAVVLIAVVDLVRILFEL